MGDMADYYGVEAEYGTPIWTPKIWKTKDGRKIPYQDLGNTHLLNILKMLRRSAIILHQARVLQATSGPQPRTDHGMDHLEMEIRAMEAETWREHVAPEFWPLYREASTRPVADEALAIVQDDCERESALIGLALLVKGRA